MKQIESLGTNLQPIPKMQRPRKIGVIAAFILSVGAPAYQAGAAAIWNLASDFSLASNPNGAWIYQLETDPGDIDTDYVPFADSTLAANTIWGTTFATSPTMWSDGTFGSIGRNDTGVTQTSADVTWEPGEVLFHPKPNFPGARMVITWEAPGDMTVDVAWAYAKRMTVGINGVGMGVLHESGGANTALRNFADPDGASGTFDNLAVAAGDKLHFRFDNWADAGGDITWADINVAQIPEPSAALLCGLIGGVGLLRRRR